jgi:hypothetical protein
MHFITNHKIQPNFNQSNNRAIDVPNILNDEPKNFNLTKTCALLLIANS